MASTQGTKKEEETHNRIEQTFYVTQQIHTSFFINKTLTMSNILLKVIHSLWEHQGYSFYETTRDYSNTQQLHKLKLVFWNLEIYLTAQYWSKGLDHKTDIFYCLMIYLYRLPVACNIENSKSIILKFLQQTYGDILSGMATFKKTRNQWKISKIHYKKKSSKRRSLYDTFKRMYIH